MSACDGVKRETRFTARGCSPFPFNFVAFVAIVRRHSDLVGRAQSVAVVLSMRVTNLQSNFCLAIISRKGGKIERRSCFSRIPIARKDTRIFRHVRSIHIIYVRIARARFLPRKNTDYTQIEPRYFELCPFRRDAQSIETFP